MTPPLRVLDLFAGAGGLSHGLAATGSFVTEVAVERDRDAAATFAANHPSTAVVCGDIAAWLDSDVVPAVDVVVGGPPCQGFSNLGSRQVRDPRNALWRRYVETLARARPLIFIMENVADFLRSGQYRDLRRETHRSGRLSEYRLEAGILNSADFGAAQIRKRAVIVGSRRELDPLGLPDPMERWVAHPRTVREAIGDLPREPLAIDLEPRSSNFGAHTVKGPYRSDELHLGRRPSALSLERYRSIPPGGNRKDLPPHLLAECWRGHSSGSGDVMGRMHWDRPSVTIRTEFWKPEKGRYLHPIANRPITHLEALRLQGFPDDYLWIGSKAEIGRQIGNAVPYDLALALGAHIADRVRVMGASLKDPESAIRSTIRES